MEKYLRYLVIILPATAIAMVGLILVVWIYLRSRSKHFQTILPVPQRHVMTQVDNSLQINQEIRNKLIAEAMDRVKSILSEEFRKKQATRISQEEFNNLYRKQQDVDAKRIESVLRIPGVASLACPTKPQDSSSLKMIDSFASLWVEELQKSGDPNPVPDTQKESESPEQKLPPPQHSMMISNNSGTGFGLETPSCDKMELGLSEVTDLSEVKSPTELRTLHDLEIFLFTASSNLCRSMMAISMAQNSGEELLVSSNGELSMMPGYDYLKQSAEVFASVASTSTFMNVPQVLKGGGTAVDDFEWRLDIEEGDVEESPPTTPVRHRPPYHLCRGIRFVYEDHPPALSLINLDPELGHGWRGPEWKEKYGKYHIYNERKGPSIYRKEKVRLASNPGVAAYYKSVRVDAKRKWEIVKRRYREARERDIIRAEIRADIHESSEWRAHLRKVYRDSSSPSESDQEIERRRAKQPGQQGGTKGGQTNQTNDPNRIKSMLTTSSSSADSDDSVDVGLCKDRKDELDSSSKSSTGSISEY